MAPHPWKVVRSKRDTSYGIFSLRTDRAVSPRTGEDHDFYILESSPWVNVIPLTPDKQVVLIRQYRHGIQGVTLEIPGGLVEENDSPERAAERELAEETGFASKRLFLLGDVHPNPAILDNRCFTFVAEDVYRTGEQTQDEKEDIEVIIEPLSRIPDLIRSGAITHALVLAAFYRFYMEYRPSLKTAGE